MGRYRKVETQTWTDKRFRELSGPAPNAQTLWLYLLSGPRTSIFPGLVVATDQVIASDLRWPLHRELMLDFSDAKQSATGGGSSGGTSRGALGECFAELRNRDMIRTDFEAGLIMLTKGLIVSPGKVRDSSKPGSPNVFVSWLKTWPEIPDCNLKDSYLAELGLFAEALGKPYVAAYEAVADCSTTGRRLVPQAVAKRSPTGTPTRRTSGTGTGTGSTQRSEIDLDQDDTDSEADPHRASDLGGGGERDRDPVRPARPAVNLGPLFGHAPAALAVPVLRVVRGDDSVATHASSVDSHGRTVSAAASASNADSDPTELARTRQIAQDARSPNPSPDSDPALIARRALGERAWERLNRERADLARELGLDPPRFLHPQLPGRVQLADRLRESGEHAESDLEHVFEVARAEARRPPCSLQFFSGSMFEPKSWARKLSMSPADVMHSSGRSSTGGAQRELDVFAAADRATAGMNAMFEAAPGLSTGDRIEMVSEPAPRRDSGDVAVRRKPPSANPFGGGVLIGSTIDGVLWTGPLEGEIAPSGMLYARVPHERWPYGPPGAHESQCNLFPHLGNDGGLFCDCAASAADDAEHGVGA